MTDSTDDPSKATNNKALKASVAASINSTTQSEPTHVGARTYTSPKHTQQVMSPTALTREAETIDTAAEKNQSSGKNPGEPSDANDSIYLFGNNAEPDPAEKISRLE
jgi:hypothetical protein